MEYRLERRLLVPRPLEAVFPFFADARNLARITPPGLGFEIIGSSDGDETVPIRMRTGLRIHYRIRPLGVPQRWTSEITVWEPPHRFVDEQVRGPYRRWVHEHTFRETHGGTEIADRVEYEMPFGPLGRLAHALLVKRQLEEIFAFRERVTRQTFDHT